MGGDEDAVGVFGPGFDFERPPGRVRGPVTAPGSECDVAGADEGRDRDAARVLGREAGPFRIAEFFEVVAAPQRERRVVPVRRRVEITGRRRGVGTPDQVVERPDVEADVRRPHERQHVLVEPQVERRLVPGSFGLQHALEVRQRDPQVPARRVVTELGPQRPEHLVARRGAMVGNEREELADTPAAPMWVVDLLRVAEQLRRSEQRDP